MTPRRNGTDRKTDVMLVRLTAQEHATLRERAAFCGISVSEYVRNCALHRQIVARIDRTALAELRRQGGLIKHLAFSDRRNAYEYRVALNLLQVTIRRLIGDSESPQEAS